MPQKTPLPSRCQAQNDAVTVRRILSLNRKVLLSTLYVENSDPRHVIPPLEENRNIHPIEEDGFILI